MGDYGVVASSGELAYDLRQTYAKIVGDHLEDIAQARKADRYSIYFKALKDLCIVVKHKFRKGKDIEKYNALVNEAVKLANQHPQTWLGKNKDPAACATIELSLNAIEMFLYEKIDDAKLFGGSNKQVTF